MIRKLAAQQIGERKIFKVLNPTGSTDKDTAIVSKILKNISDNSHKL